MRWAIFAVLALACSATFAQLPAPGEPGAPDDPRYCGEPARATPKPGQTTKPRIKRSRAVLRAFVAVFPCPPTLLHQTSCPGWAMDHTIPLASGGCDSAANLTWLPDEIKSCADPACKDRWERTYHAVPRGKVTIPDQEFVWDDDDGVSGAAPTP